MKPLADARPFDRREGWRFGEQALEVKNDLQEMGGTVRDAARETLGQVGEQASEYCEQGRDKVHGIACACEQFNLETKESLS